MKVKHIFSTCIVVLGGVGLMACSVILADDWARYTFHREASRLAEALGAVAVMSENMANERGSTNAILIAAEPIDPGTATKLEAREAFHGGHDKQSGRG